jgi:surfeit locus 1 family protein
VVGAADYARERVGPGRTFDGTPGVAVLTPVRLADGSAVLVDRGWVPSPDARTADLAATREGDTLRVPGLAVRGPRARSDADPAALADSFPYPLAPLIVQWLPDGGAWSRSRLPVRRWPAPALDDGPHHAYAIQWFSFAAIALVGAVALLWKRSARSPEVGKGR